MKKHLLGITLFLLLATGCGTTPAASSVTSTEESAVSSEEVVSSESESTAASSSKASRKLQQELIAQISEEMSEDQWCASVKGILQKYNPEGRPNEVLFVGGSNFARWTEIENELLPYKVQNHAFGGSADTDQYNYAKYNMYPYNPQIIFFQTGSNEFVQSTAETDEDMIEECVSFKKKIYEEYHTNLPNCKFVVVSGLPLPGRDQYKNVTLAINDQMKAYCATKDYLEFLDTEALTYDRETDTYHEEKFIATDSDYKIHLYPEYRTEWANSYILPKLQEMNAPQYTQAELDKKSANQF